MKNRPVVATNFEVKVSHLLSAVQSWAETMKDTKRREVPRSLSSQKTMMERSISPRNIDCKIQHCQHFTKSSANTTNKLQNETFAECLPSYSNSMECPDAVMKVTRLFECCFATMLTWQHKQTVIFCANDFQLNNNLHLIWWFTRIPCQSSEFKRNAQIANLHMENDLMQDTKFTLNLQKYQVHVPVGDED